MAEVDLIIPVYRPGNNWAINLTQALSNGLDTTHIYNLIIVNDGGKGLHKDEKILLERVSDLGHINEVKIIEYKDNQGKGYAIRKGIEVSSGELIVYTDDDLPYGVDAINDMIKRLSDNAEVVLPDRGADYFRSLPLKRRIISKGLIWMNRLLMGMKHPDTQAGLKGFNRQVANLIQEGKENGFLFEVEWIQKVEKAGIAITSIPVKINVDALPSGVPGGDIWKLLNAYLRLFRSR